MTWDAVHEINATHAREHADATREEAIELLRRNSEVASAAIRGLQDAQLDRAAPISLNADAPLTCQFFLEDHAVLVQFTPPGSQCSVHFGRNLTSVAPGSAQSLWLIVSDIQAARAELVERGIEVSEVFHFAGWNRVDPDARLSGPAPGGAATHRSCRSATPTATAG